MAPATVERRRGGFEFGGEAARSAPNVIGGPSGSPMLMVWPSVITTDDTRRPPTNMPLRLPLSNATQRPLT
jgi:hypothetical protein